ncbi:MAG: NAD-dependent epimerase/dehydratase family protein [Chitinophagaceae bacterium]
MKDSILVIGACGQIGVDLTLALRDKYGSENVVAADIAKIPHPLIADGRYIRFDVTDVDLLRAWVLKENVTQAYLLAAVLSATGEQNPEAAWHLNMKSLLNVLSVARETGLEKVFWPSSIAVFGGSPKENCPQKTTMTPATMYGISKLAGENWCNYYYNKYGVDVRSLRYPGLISYKAVPGGGTTDYAIEIFHKAITVGTYQSYLQHNTRLPMLYMDDAIRATLELMDAPKEKITIRTSYNLAGTSFTPAELALAIQHHVPDFTMQYKPDSRQAIADSWPASIDDSVAQAHWGWQPQFDLKRMTRYMFAFVNGIYSTHRREREAVEL